MSTLTLPVATSRIFKRLVKWLTEIIYALELQVCNNLSWQDKPVVVYKLIIVVVVYKLITCQCDRKIEGVSQNQCIMIVHNYLSEGLLRAVYQQ